MKKVEFIYKKKKTVFFIKNILVRGLDVTFQTILEILNEGCVVIKKLAKIKA